jgi:hypothetical protein
LTHLAAHLPERREGKSVWIRAGLWFAIVDKVAAPPRRRPRLSKAQELIDEYWISVGRQRRDELLAAAAESDVKLTAEAAGEQAAQEVSPLCRLSVARLKDEIPRSGARSGKNSSE